MHFEAHAGIGWLLAQTWPGDRRFRIAVTAAAVAPDLDVISYIFGPFVYLKYHHVIGHNFIFSLIISAAAVLYCRNSRLPAFIYTQIAFYAHYFGDYFFTLYPLYYFWPFSNTQFLSASAIPLAHWLNTFFLCLGIAAMFLTGFFLKRTVLEIFSPELDKRIVNMFFTSRTLNCHVCGRKCNEHCYECNSPVCLRHASLAKGFKPVCMNCM